MQNPLLNSLPSDFNVPSEFFNTWVTQYSLVGAILVDIQSKDIIDMNAEAHKLLVNSNSEYLNQVLKIENFIVQDEHDLRNFTDDLFMQDGSYFETYFKIESDMMLPCRVSIKHIEHDNRTLALVLFQDISTQKKLQRNLEIKQEGLVDTINELELKNIELKKMYELLVSRQSSLVNSYKMTALGEMASGIAHEINNPLAIITGKLFFIKKNLKSPTPSLEMMDKELTKLEDTIQRIKKIIDGLQYFSRNPDHECTDEFDLLRLIEDSSLFYSEKCKNNSITLKLDYPSESSIFVDGKKAQLTQVLLNLLNNSFDAVQELDEKWIHIHIFCKDKVVHIELTDSGRGIPQEVVEKMMQPFYSTKELGTGLGLSIAKGIIEDHKGTFTYDSHSPNTKFVIQLPISATL